MRWAEPSSCRVDVEAGRLEGGTGSYIKRLADLDGVYADEAAFAQAVRQGGDAVAYEVTEFRPSEAAGDMIFGITRMAPGRIGAEYPVTRGHLHARADRSEIYTGERGRGLMLLETPDGDTRILEVAPRVVVYVPPYWIHRSVNVGADELVMSFAYPADSGQDYEIIARSGGLRQRVVEDGRGGWTVVENAHYRPRSAAEAARLMAA